MEDGGTDHMADDLVSRADELSSKTQREIGKTQKHSKNFLPAFKMLLSIVRAHSAISFNGIKKIASQVCAKACLGVDSRASQVSIDSHGTSVIFLREGQTLVWYKDKSCCAGVVAARRFDLHSSND